VPVSSLLTPEERAAVDRAIAHQVYMAKRDERRLLYFALAPTESRRRLGLECAPVARQ